MEIKKTISASAGAPGPWRQLVCLGPVRPWGVGLALSVGLGAPCSRSWGSAWPTSGPSPIHSVLGTLASKRWPPCAPGRAGAIVRLLGLHARHLDAGRCRANEKCRCGLSTSSWALGRSGRQGSAVPGTTAASGDNLLHRSSTWRSEAKKLLGLVYPERWRLSAAVGFLTVSSIITMSAPFFLGRIIDVIYTDPTVDYTSKLTSLCLALSGVFLCGAASGSVTALVGSSGSGKSTVVSLLLRLYDLHSGTISLDGHDIRQLNPVWLRSKIGTVSQEPILFSCTIAENIAYGEDDPTHVTAKQVERAADMANAATFMKHFPDGFNTVVGEKGILLSGGQKQRIAIARALLKNPKILLLDEATSALDAENEYLVQEALDRIMKGRTVLIIAHQLSTIKNANMVAVLNQGKITEFGKHEELLSKPDGIYRKLMNKQSFMSS
ncbi:PREDICTED: ATP-binding cassette sub-family B member 10, mitochondrial-like [Elephantulus edwardii]|uniref:ATP-binding cassette sub-family B member 10, mitochondrial-like n=1 Tax=Elephantulus edwardii TaxID=28737 RepID=UPI0003F087E5|nr:PREDICTED: ATP-binding cassette sub-family B member 10, mitochondrial-like [Elephantulus edwardii]